MLSGKFIVLDTKCLSSIRLRDHVIHHSCDFEIPISHTAQECHLRADFKTLAIQHALLNGAEYAHDGLGDAMASLDNFLNIFIARKGATKNRSAERMLDIGLEVVASGDAHRQTLKGKERRQATNGSG